VEKAELEIAHALFRDRSQRGKNASEFLLGGQPGVVSQGRPRWNQTEIIAPLYPYTDDNGAIRPQAMLGGWNSDIRLKMSTCG